MKSQLNLIQSLSLNSENSRNWSRNGTWNMEQYLEKGTTRCAGTIVVFPGIFTKTPTVSHSINWHISNLYQSAHSKL